MPIAPNTQFDHYEILAPIGKGGMGEVFRAQDTRLNREVALKVLPAEFAQDADRLRRFEQEAMATSSLNHPNILTVYDFGNHEGNPFLVMELLEGEELRAQLEAGALAPRKAIDYAQQIAAGLAAAHEKGIVHRDLKPENLFVTKDGRVKILDFGLAKLRPPRNAPTGSDVATQKQYTSPGTVMGTVAYMSPEQVRGQDLEQRSDIFSFGLILYEMLAGQRAFQAASQAETMAAIANAEPPDLTELNSKVTPQLERIVRRCLEKKPEMRFHSAHDLGFALSTLTTPSGARLETATALPALTESLPVSKAGLFGNARLWMAVAAVAVLGLLAALTFAVKSLRQPSSGAQVTRLSINLPFRLPKGADENPAAVPFLALSPDGRRLVFSATDAAGKRQLWLRPLDSFTSQPLVGTEEGVAPFWSPDGKYLAFFADQKLKKLNLASGLVEILWPEADAYDGGVWNEQGIILFNPGESKQGIWRINAAGGQPEIVNEAGITPSFLPDGKHYLFAFEGPQNRKQNGLYVGSLDSKEHKQLLATPDVTIRFVWAAPGYVLYSPDRATLVARAFDADRLEWQGEPFRLADNIVITTGGISRFAVSANGVLAYLQGIEHAAVQLTWRDRSGKPLSGVGPVAPWFDFSLSPDERFALLIRQEPNYSPSLWSLDLAQGTTTNYRSPGQNFSPLWSPDGKQFVWSLARGAPHTLFLRQFPGNAPEEQLGGGPVTNLRANSWSPDGKFVVFSYSPEDIGSGLPADLWLMPLTGERKEQPLLQTKANERNGRVSPDGNWLAYQSDEAGSDDIYVTQFPQPARAWRISKSGGVNPFWRSDGKELYFVAGNKLMAVSVTLGAEVQPGTPQPFFEIEGTNYAPSKDGQRFLVPVVTEKAPPPPINIVLNWTADLKR